MMNDAANTINDKEMFGRELELLLSKYCSKVTAKYMAMVFMARAGQIVREDLEDQEIMGV